LLKDSTEEQEWQETEAKLETMRGVLSNRQSFNRQSHDV
jgi:isochorismate synthase EntC